MDLELPRLGISVTITSRLKTADSALHKARRKGLSLDALHDLLGLRIVCEREMDCYRVLHVVHAPWLAVPGEYDDYIARPKGNGYRSLHTAVVSDKGPVFEVQIRSRQMHWEAEQGPAAHWRYQLQRAELILGSQRG